MKTLPRHLLLAAVVLTVCCAERQAVAATVDLQKVAAEVAGERYGQARNVEQTVRQRRESRRYIRPAAVTRAHRMRVVFGARRASVTPQSPVVHKIFPPSRFRLPPPALLV